MEVYAAMLDDMDQGIGQIVETLKKTGQFESVHKNSQAAFNTFRPEGAVWAIAIDPKSSHDCRNSRQLAIPFFDKMLLARLPKEGTDLRAVMVGAWAGDLETLKIMDQRFRRGEVIPTCWLIDEDFAKKWQEYCQTGEVKDITAPPSPTDVVAGVADKGVTLTWKATADLGGGLKAFIVQRNGKVVATFGGEKMQR